MRLLFLVVALLGLAALLPGQALTSPQPAGAGGARTSGSLTTLFKENNGYAGNMFDILPSVDLTITGIDVNITAPGSTQTIEVYYLKGTSFGNESGGPWVQLARRSAVSAGTNQPTFVDLSGNGVIFEGGQQYGMFVWLESYGAASLKYTDGGPKVFSTSELALQTNCGKGDGLTSSTFFPRQWNGTIYYDCATSATISVRQLVGGQHAVLDCTDFTPGGVIYASYSLFGGGPTPTPWGDAALTRPVVIVPPFLADANGAASQTLFVPPIGSGYPIWIQALDWTAGELSNGLAELIG